MNINFNFIRKLLKKRILSKTVKDKKTKSIALINQYFPPDYAATGQLLDDLTKRIGNSEMNFIVFTSQPSYSFDISHAPKKELSNYRLILRTKTSRLFPRTVKGKTINSLIFLVFCFFKLLKEYFRSNIKLFIYSTEPPFLPIFAYFLSFFFKKPYLLILYDLYPELLTYTKTIRKDSIIVKVWEFLNRYAYKRATNLIVLSEPMKDAILSNYKSIEESKIKIIYSWVDQNKIKPIQKEQNFFIKKNKLENKFVILYSGNFGRWHDIETIQEASNNLKLFQDIIFVFIGSGPRLNALKRYFLENKINNSIFLTSQPLNILPYSLSCADLALVSQLENTSDLAAPSKFYGHLACATPVAGIAPSSSYLRKIIKTHNLGKGFNNGDNIGLSEWILYLKNNPSEKKELGNNCRSYLMKNATTQIIVKKYLDIIKKSIK